MPSRQAIGRLLGPLIFVFLLMLPVAEGLSVGGMKVAAVAALMATWWITEAVPIPATALLPIALFPLLGVMKSQQVTLAYSNHLIYLFMGGFLIAVTIEKWGLHKRIALHTIRLIGVSPRRIILGFMLATAFLSMWISNTATAMLMTTIGMAVMLESHYMSPEGGNGVAGHCTFETPLMLGIAYSASIGGVATLIGTPPNAILAGMIEKFYGISIGFTEWILFALPLSIGMLLLSWLYLTRLAYPCSKEQPPGARTAIDQALQQLGPISKQERRVLVIFLAVAAAWILRGLVPVKDLAMLGDSSIAILGALVLFVTPSGIKPREYLLDWTTAVKIPWDIIILFGGGFALAEGFSTSGLTEWLAVQLTVLQNINMITLIAMVVMFTIFLTELTSNTAVASLLLPVMGALAVSVGIHPLVTMVSVTIAASFAFMLPVATPPNAIVFASRSVTIQQMAKGGFMLNLLAVLMITGFVILLLPSVFGIDVHAKLG